MNYQVFGFDDAEVEVWSGHPRRDTPGIVSIDINEHYGHVSGTPGHARVHLSAHQARQLAVELLNAADHIDPQPGVATAVDVHFNGPTVTITPSEGANTRARTSPTT